MHKNFELITNGKHIAEWKPKGLSDESFKLVTTSGNNLAPLISYYGYKKKVKFNGNILRQPKVTYTHQKSCEYLRHLQISRLLLSHR